MAHETPTADASSDSHKRPHTALTLADERRCGREKLEIKNQTLVPGNTFLCGHSTLKATSVSKAWWTSAMSARHVPGIIE